MPRKVIIPTDVKDKLQQLTQLQNETQVLLLYQRNGNDCVVVSYFILGGNESTTQTHGNSNLAKLIKEFLSENPTYKFIAGHTHTESIVSNRESHYADHFSTGDERTYTRALQTDPEFIGAVITPTTIKLWAPDNPQLEFCPPHPKFVHEKIYEKIRDVARRKGLNAHEFNLGHFVSTPERRIIKEMPKPRPK